MRTTFTCLLGVAALALGGCGGSGGAPALQQAQRDAKPAAQRAKADASPRRDLRRIEYAGKDGETALELLEDNGYDVTTEQSSLGDYVTAIGDVQATRTKYWSYYVDGKMPNLGAGSYTTKDGKRVEWRYGG